MRGMPSPTKVVIGYHGHCFDGMSSAVMLTRLMRHVDARDLAFTYRGLDHQAGGSFVPEDILAGDVNAVVDFRYTTSPKLTWWFDHHKSGLANEQEKGHFEADRSQKKFYDPACSSCCKLIVDIAKKTFGFHAPELDDLLYWADMIDAARFPNAKFAVDLDAPALKLMTVIEAHGDDAFLAPRIDKLAQGATIAELVEDPQVQSLLAPLVEAHRTACETIRTDARMDGGVVTFDLIGKSAAERYNKFIPYWLFPDSRYCVAVSAGPTKTKISVGSNPWAPVPRTHDISALCAKYGGGGHPVVGAVSLGATEFEKGRAIAKEIADALRQ